MHFGIFVGMVKTHGMPHFVMLLWLLPYGISPHLLIGQITESQSTSSASLLSVSVFIFHNWVEHQLLSNTSKRIFHLDAIATTHVILFPLCFFLVALFISWILSELLHMTKVGKFLIG